MKIEFPTSLSLSSKLKILILSIAISFLFIGCSKIYIHKTLENFGLNGSAIMRKHFSCIIPDDTGLKDGWKKTDNYISNGVIFSYNVPYLAIYSFSINTRSSENHLCTTESMLPLFGKKTIFTHKVGDKERDLQRLEAIKNKDEKYLKERFLKDRYWNVKGIVSAKFSNINHYSAIEIMTETKHNNRVHYEKKYYIYAYTRNEKLKEYEITISATIDKSQENYIQPSVEYSFEDMLNRSKTSLDSLKLIDEDIGVLCGS